jgi:hypothetical protein
VVNYLCDGLHVRADWRDEANVRADWRDAGPNLVIKIGSRNAKTPNAPLDTPSRIDLSPSRCASSSMSRSAIAPSTALRRAR